MIDGPPLYGRMFEMQILFTAACVPIKVIGRQAASYESDECQGSRVSGRKDVPGVDHSFSMLLVRAGGSLQISVN